jgi:hypothetical protein
MQQSLNGDASLYIFSSEVSNIPLGSLQARKNPPLLPLFPATKTPAISSQSDNSLIQVMFNVLHVSHWQVSCSHNVGKLFMFIVSAQQPHSLWNCAPAVPSMCGRQQQQHQKCDCVLGVCTCSRDLTHDDPDDANADESMTVPCSIDISSVSSFLPRTHPLQSKARCLRAQQYISAKDQVLIIPVLFLQIVTCFHAAADDRFCRV